MCIAARSRLISQTESINALDHSTGTLIAETNFKKSDFSRPLLLLLEIAEWWSAPKFLKV